MAAVVQTGANAQCPRCFADNTPGAAQCAACGQRLSPPGRAASAAKPANVPPQSPTATMRCRCGAQLRISEQHRGKKIRCPKCQSPLFVALSGSAKPEATGSVHELTARDVDLPTSVEAGTHSSDHQLQTINDKQLLRELIAAVKTQPPRQTDPPVLKEKLGKRAWARLVAEAADPHSIVGDVTVFFRTWIRKLAGTGDSRAVELIIPHLESPRTPVRDAALEALATFRDAAAVPTLAKLLVERDSNTREGAIRALGQIRDARAVPPLVQLGVQDPHARLAVHQALQEIGESAVETLVPLLLSPDPAVVLEAALALAHLPTPAAVDGLIAVTNHPAVVIRAQAVESLARMGNSKAIPAIIQRLGDPDAAVRAQAAHALARMPDVKALPGLLKAVTDADADVVAGAAKALAELGDPRTAGALRTLLAHERSDVRASAARGLGNLGDPTTAGALIAAAKDADAEVRLQAISGLRKFDQRTDVVQQLLESLTETMPALRLRAVQVLGEQQAVSAASQLAHLLGHDHVAEIRGAAARALGSLRQPTHLPALEEALHDEFFVRCQAIAAMAEIGDATSLPVLLALLRDPMPEIQYHAAIALGELGHKNAMRPLELLLKHENDLARRGAAKALVKLGHPQGEKLLEQAARKRRGSIFQQIVKRLPAPAVEVLLPHSLAGRVVTWGTMAGICLLPAAIYWSSSRSTVGPTPVIVQRGKVSSVAWTAEGKSLVVGRTRGQIEVWDVSAKKLQETLNSDSNGAIARLFGGGAAGKVLFERDGALLHRHKSGWETLPAHDKPIRAMQVSLNGQFAVTLGEDHQLCVWNLHDESLTKAFKCPMLDARVVAITNDGGRIAVGSASNRAIGIEVASGTLLFDITLSRQPAPVKALGFHPQGHRLATLDDQGNVRLWDENGQPTVALPHPSEKNPTAGNAVWFDPGGQPLLFVNFSGQVVRWELLKKQATPVEGLMISEFFSVSPDGRQIATGSTEDSYVTVFDLDSQTGVQLDTDR
jgi:HEAT repeat protein